MTRCGRYVNAIRERMKAKKRQVPIANSMVFKIPIKDTALSGYYKLLRLVVTLKIERCSTVYSKGWIEITNTRFFFKRSSI